jgi:hypothetical protein
MPDQHPNRPVLSNLLVLVYKTGVPLQERYHKYGLERYHLTYPRNRMLACVCIYIYIFIKRYWMPIGRWFDVHIYIYIYIYISKPLRTPNKKQLTQLSRFLWAAFEIWANMFCAIYIYIFLTITLSSLKFQLLVGPVC